MKLHELKEALSAVAPQGAEVPEPVKRAGRGHVQTAVMDFLMSNKGQFFSALQVGHAVGLTEKQVGDMMYKASVAGTLRKNKDWTTGEVRYAFDGAVRPVKSPTVGKTYELRVKTVYTLRLADGKEIELTLDQFKALNGISNESPDWVSDDE